MHFYCSGDPHPTPEPQAQHPPARTLRELSRLCSNRLAVSVVAGIGIADADASIGVPAGVSI